MAQFVGTRIDIDGTTISQFSSLTIAQSIFEHHNFRLICPTEAIDGTKGILNSSRNMIGGTIKIQLQVVGGNGTLQFAGVVTQVEASRRSGHAGDIIISGFSPTILLDNGPHCQSWEKKAVKNIAQDVLGQFPQNLLQPNVNPTYGETLSYTVQYKETAWQFLSRIAAFGILCNMLVAVFMVHRQFGFFANWSGQQKGEGIEYHLLTIAITIAIMIAGSGALSVDAALSGGPDRRI